MKKWVLLLFICIMITMASTISFSWTWNAGTDITSFKDPKYINDVIYSGVIFVKLVDLKTQMKIEDMFVSRMVKKYKINIIQSYKLFHPTREFSIEKKWIAMKNIGIRRAFVVALVDQGVDSKYVPDSTTTTTGSANVIGNYVYYDEKSTSGGGRHVNKPYAEFGMNIIDVDTMGITWIAKIETGGNAYANFDDIFDSMTEKTINQLAKDQVIVKK